MSSSTYNSAGNNIADLAASLLQSKPSHSQSSSNTDTNAKDSAASARGMSHTGSWKPALDRRQSWNAEEYKHDVLKRQYMGGEGGAAGKGGGFSEV